VSNKYFVQEWKRRAEVLERRSTDVDAGILKFAAGRIAANALTEGFWSMRKLEG
jgi:hypothetical protein